MHYLIITGSRTFPNLHDTGYLFLSQQIFDYWSLTVKREPLTVVHGDCPTGPDAWAKHIAGAVAPQYKKPIYEERFPADWKTHGKAAGPIRNENMIRIISQEYPSMVSVYGMALRYRDSRGTSHAISMFEKYSVNYTLHQRY